MLLSFSAALFYNVTGAIFPAAAAVKPHFMKRLSNSTKAVLATLICHVAWGFSFMASRTGLNYVPVFQLLSHRYLIAFLIMSALILTGRFKVDFKGKPVLKVLFLAFMEPVIYIIGEQYGILHSTTIFSGVMTAMVPIAATLAAWPFLKEKPTRGQLLFSLLSVSGVIGIGLLSKDSGTLDWIGLVALLVAVASAAGYSMFSRFISGSFTPFERTYVMMCLGAAVFTPLSFLQMESPVLYLAPFKEPVYLITMLYLGPLASVICYFLSGYALTYLPVARESVFINLTTAVSVFAGAVFLHEPFTWLSLLFCLLILIGIWGVQKSSPKE